MGQSIIRGIRKIFSQSGGGASSNAPYVTESRATISAAQINASDVTGVTLVAAPGANKVIFVTGIVAVYKGLTTGFTTIGVLKLTYNSTSDILTLFDGGQLATTDTIPTQGYLSADRTPWASADSVNKPIVAICDAAIAGGAGSIDYIISYITLDFN